MDNQISSGKQNTPKRSAVRVGSLGVQDKKKSTFKINFNQIILVCFDFSDPGLVLTSVIAVDQVGDLSTDTFDFSTLQYNRFHDDHFAKDYKLKLTNPSTCPYEK